MSKIKNWKSLGKERATPGSRPAFTWHNNATGTHISLEYFNDGLRPPHLVEISTDNGDIFHRHFVTQKLALDYVRDYMRRHG